MRLGLMLGYSGAQLDLPVALVQEAERLGYDVVWTAEAYGSDAVTPLAWLGAHTTRIGLGTAVMQIPGRTPANAAMTAMTLDQLSGGRFRLGLGMSGPQVVEGWHGQAYGRPVMRTREYVSIVRRIIRREAPLTYEGVYYQIPYQGPGATGLGKALKSTLHGRANLPIYLGAIGPRNVALAAEIADGWLPILFAPEEYDRAHRDHVKAGFAAAPGKDRARFDIAPMVQVVVGNDLGACWLAVKAYLALYIGGMGARGRNFYFDLACRYGHEAAAVHIQDLYLGGQKMEAAFAVPDELVDAVALCGPRERIAERLAMWKSGPATTLNVSTNDVETLRLMAELVL